MTRVVVLGATGRMGGRLTALLRRYAPHIEVVPAGSSGRGAVPGPAAVDVKRGAGLPDLLAGARLAINCVGPYDWSPRALLEACVAARCHYADLSEDAHFIDAVRSQARAAQAGAAGVLALPGCSTTPGLLQLLASQPAFAAPGIVAFDAVLEMASNSPPSRALLLGLLTPLGRSGPGGLRWFGELGSFAGSARPGLRLLGGRYPAGFAPEGVRVHGRSVPLRFWAGFDLHVLTRALRLVAPVLGRLPRGALRRVAAALVPPARLVARLAPGAHGTLALIGRGASGAELARAEIHARARGLDIPVAPALWLAQRLSANAAPPRVGYATLDQLIDWADARAWLLDAGYELYGC